MPVALTPPYSMYVWASPLFRQQLASILPYLPLGYAHTWYVACGGGIQCTLTCVSVCPSVCELTPLIKLNGLLLWAAECAVCLERL